MHKIPLQGRIYIVKNGTEMCHNTVISQVKQSNLLFNSNIQSRSWLFDVLNCVNCMPDTFSLADMYVFDRTLSQKHPQNKNIKPKIRQQLQILRDRGIIEFLGNGKYKKL
jgi:type II restriction enzyme